MKLSRFALVAAAATGAFAFSSVAAAKTYVSNELADVPPQEVVKIDAPKPVQLLFQFKTKGSLNARATKYLAPTITKLVSSSGKFASVSGDPVDGGAILSITIDNVPQEGAAGKGFVTGLTLGLKGTTIADYYVADAELAPSTTAQTIKASAKHAMITTIGAAAPPENATPTKNVEEAVMTISRQLVDHLVNDLAKDSAFPGKGVADPAASAANPDVATTPPPVAPTEVPAAPSPAIATTPGA